MSSLPIPWQFEGAPAIMAHRGWASRYPENSRQAIEAALQLGIRYIEFDIQFSSDSVPMVYHDDSLERCSSGSGFIFDHSADELGKMLLEGSEVSEGIPTLAEVVDIFKRQENSVAVVEIKEQTLLRFGREETMKRLLEVLKPIEKQTLLISFDLPSVKMAQEYYANSREGGRVGWVLRHYHEKSRGELEELAPEFVIVNKDKVEGDLWEGDWLWMAYEIETEEQAAEWRERGLDLVESKKCGELLETKLFSNS